MCVCVCIHTHRVDSPRRYVRYIANALGVIPVERPQDLRTKGTGRVTPSPDDPTLLLGVGTRFRTQFKKGDMVSWGVADAKGGPVAVGCTLEVTL